MAPPVIETIEKGFFTRGDYKAAVGVIKTDFGNFAIFKKETTIGRVNDYARENDIELTDGYVSAEHAKIYYDEGTDTFTYRDRSKNGSTVNGQAVHNAKIKLNDGAKIVVGLTELIFLKITARLRLGSKVIKTLPRGTTITIDRDDVSAGNKYDTAVSRSHLRIWSGSGRFYVEDMSTNGTTIIKKGKEIELDKGDSTVLKSLTKIRFPNGAELIFELFVQEPVGKTTGNTVTQSKRFVQEQWEHLLGIAPGGWAYFGRADNKITGWKFHVFSDELDDLFAVGKILIPFLKKKNYYWKTYGDPEDHIKLMTGIQRGKAFTVYITCDESTSIDAVRRTARGMARRIDAILVKNGLASSDANFIGDRRVPGTSSGRVWYRYDRKSVGPGPMRSLSDYAGAKKRPNYNLKGNPDIF